MSPLASEADAVRLVEDVIESTSVSHACMCHVPTVGTGAAVVAALVEAGWLVKPHDRLVFELPKP